MKYTLNLNKLYAWYRVEVGLSREAANAVMPPFDYSQPVIIQSKPTLGLCLIEQDGKTAIVPDQVLEHSART